MTCTCTAFIPVSLNVLQMLSRLIEQVEDQLHRLEKGAPSAAKSDITKATNLVKDANKSKLVSLCGLIFVLC